MMIPMHLKVRYTLKTFGIKHKSPVKSYGAFFELYDTSMKIESVFVNRLVNIA